MTLPDTGGQFDTKSLGLAATSALMESFKLLGCSS